LSYSPVFSAQFIVYTASTPNSTFVVPDGFTAVMRDASVVQDVGGYAWELNFANSEEAPVCAVDYASSLGVFEVHQWQGRVVVPAGGVIGVVFSTVGPTPSCYVGGYLLRNVVS